MNLSAVQMKSVKICIIMSGKWHRTKLYLLSLLWVAHLVFQLSFICEILSILLLSYILKQFLLITKNTGLLHKACITLLRLWRLKWHYDQHTTSPKQRQPSAAMFTVFLREAGDTQHCYSVTAVVMHSSIKIPLMWHSLAKYGLVCLQQTPTFLCLNI